MLIAAIVALVAVSAASGYRTHFLLINNGNPRSNYEVEKICELAEKERYQPKDEEKFDDEIRLIKSIFGGAQSKRKSIQEFVNCCHKPSQYEKKQCLKDVRENFIDKSCDSGLKHSCCKTEAVARYSCFTKNPLGEQSDVFGDRRRPVVSPLEVEEELLAGEWPSTRQFEKQRRRDERENSQILRELDNMADNRRRGRLSADDDDLDRDDDTRQNERFSYRERLDDQLADRKKQRWADKKQKEESVEFEIYESAERLRAYGSPSLEEALYDSSERRHPKPWSTLEREGIEDQWVGRKQPWGPSYRSVRDIDQEGIFEPFEERRTDWENRQGLAEEVYETEKRQAERDAEKVKRQAWAQGSSWTEAETLASQVYEQEKELARRDARKVGRFETEDLENFETLKDLDQEENIFTGWKSWNAQSRRCQQSHQCRRKLEKFTEIAAQKACYKNEQRGGRHVGESCCEAGSIVGETSGRHGSLVCVPALFKFQQKSQGCGVSHKPQCKQAFVECCRRQAEISRREISREDLE